MKNTVKSIKRSDNRVLSLLRKRVHCEPFVSPKYDHKIPNIKVYSVKKKKNKTCKASLKFVIVVMALAMFDP